MGIIYYETGDYLEHHGIKGQKHGRRRYQNPDGSLTLLGKLRYRKNAKSDEVDERTPTEKHAAASKAAKEREAKKREMTPEEKLEYEKLRVRREEAKAKRPEAEAKAAENEEARQKKIKDNSLPEKMKPAKQMTNEQLRDSVERLRLEKTYNDLMKEVRPDKLQRAKQVVANIAADSFQNIGKQGLTYAMGYGINKAAQKMGHKNAKTPLFNKDGSPKIDDDGFKMMVDSFENVVNPWKGQKDK